MADEISIKFGGDASQLQQELTKAKAAVVKLQKSVKASGDEIESSFAKRGKRAVKELQSASKALQVEFGKIEKAASFAGSVVGVVSQIDKLGSSIAGLRGETERYESAQTEINKTFSDTAAELAKYVDASAIIEDFSVGIAASFAGAGAFVTSLADDFDLLFKTASFTLRSIPAMAEIISDSFNGLDTDIDALDRSLKALLTETAEGRELAKLQDQSLETGGAIGKAAEAAQEAANAILSTRQAAKETVPELEKLGNSSSDLEDLEKALSKLGRIEKGAEEKQLEGVEKISAAYSRQFLAVYNIEQAINDLTLTEDQRVQAAEQIFATLEALHEAEAADKQKFRDKEAEENQKALDARLKREKKAADERLDVLEDEANKALEKALRFQEGVKSIKEQNIQAVAEFMGETSDIVTDLMKRSEGKNKAQAKAMFAIQKATAIAQATINGALAVSQALTQFPGPPVTFPLAKTVGAMALVNVAQIAAQSPSFHIGTRVADLAPDEMRITRREGLAVLTPQGMQSGGAEAVANANAGINQAGQQTVVFMYEHQMFDATIEDNVRRPNSPLGAMIRRSSYGHRRRNG